MTREIFFPLFFILLAFSLAAQQPFRHSVETRAKPWTDAEFYNNPDNFQFAIVSDRTGGHRPGVFGKALEKLNLLNPEFVMSVGDLIEGYTTDTAEIAAQWMEFDSILSSLEMRFFALPGNHDISNDIMRSTWLERYGSSYYHYRYKDVLFLAFDSNDGEGVLFSREQLDYFKGVIRENEDVRWTMIFMHHPIWNYREFNGFAEIEEVLEDRPYTVVAGHTHRYFKTVRQNRNYYILATTGGGSDLKGPRLGQFDHVTWVTMTEEGPELVHLQLQGILNDDVLSDATAPLAMALFNASRMEKLILQKDEHHATAYLRIENTMDKPDSMNESSGLFRHGQEKEASGAAGRPLIFEGRFFHNHHIDPSESVIRLEIPPGSAEQIAIDLEMAEGVKSEDMDPLELDWSISFDSPELEPPFQLTGVLDVEPDFAPEGLSFTPMDIFLDHHEVTLEHPYQNLRLRYTTDGSEPTAQSALYTSPIPMTQTTIVKARFFDAADQGQSEGMEKVYRKVQPYAPAKVQKTQLENGLRYRYYEGEFSTQIPDFDTLTVMKTGITDHFNMEELSMRKDHYALQFEGYLEVPEEGIYTLYTRSDDGSRLYIHDELIVDNDGSHSARTRYGNVALEAGLHPIRIAYFEDFLGQQLEIGYETGNGGRRRVLFTELWYKN